MLSSPFQSQTPGRVVRILGWGYILIWVWICKIWYHSCMHKKRKPSCSPAAWVRLSNTVSLQSLDDTFMLLDCATQKSMCLIMTESVAVLFKDQSENIYLTCVYLLCQYSVCFCTKHFSRSFSGVQDLFPDLCFAYDELRSLNQVPQAKVKLQWCVDHFWDHISFIRVTWFLLGAPQEEEVRGCRVALLCFCNPSIASLLEQWINSSLLAFPHMLCGFFDVLSPKDKGDCSFGR